MGDAMGRRPRMLAIATVTLVVSLSTLTGLRTDQLQIEWGEPETINVSRSADVISVKSVVANGTEYLFAMLSLYSDNDAYYGLSKIVYLQRLADGWSAPTVLELDRSVDGEFDVLYDEPNSEFLLFFRNYGYSSSSTGLYLARGPLGDLGPSQPVVVQQVGAHVPYPSDMSAVLGDDGTIDLFYRSITESTENLNRIYHTTFNGSTWSEPENLGWGNSPCAIRGRDGKLQLYSNLWTYTDEVQYCVDEWSVRDGTWAHEALTTSARDCNVEPFVLEDGSGDRFLVYNHEENEVGAMTDLLLQIRPHGGAWGRYVKIVTDLPGAHVSPWVYHYGIESPCATIHDGVLNVYYVHLGVLCTLPGSIE